MNHKPSRNFTPTPLRSGFTLIELLVVIAIIGLLASIVLASLNTARSKARDAKRMSELHSLQTAVELYYSSVGHYPINGSWQADCWQPTGNWISDSGNYSWSTGYIKQPHDPVDTCVWPYDSTQPNGSSATYAYYSGDGKSYAIIARLENDNQANIQHANTLWLDGKSLYSQYGWSPWTYAIVSQ